MKIWLINLGEQIPSDPGRPRLLRTGIMAQYLSERGHDVTWWNGTVNHQEKIQRHEQTHIEEKTPEGYRLIQLYGRMYKRNVSGARIISHIENARSFRQTAPGRPRPDVILCGYPMIELARAASEYAVENKVPIAIDFRDQWPEVFAEQVPNALSFLNGPLFGLWNKSMIYTVTNATAITGVTDGFVNWALDKAKRRRGPLDQPFHLAVNPQKPDDRALATAARFWDEQGIVQEADELIGCFPGTLSRRLDLMALIKGLVGLSPDEKKRIKFVVCGRGDLDADLSEAARHDENIIFAGWRNASEISCLLERCHFGTIPYKSTADFRIHYPNKLGEYLGFGLPVMTGLHGSTRQLLSDHDLGFFYEEGKPASITKCLRGILAQKDQLASKKQQAQKVYEDLFDGAKIYPAFCDYLESLAGQTVGNDTRDGA